MKKSLLEKHCNDVGDVQIIFRYPPRTKVDEAIVADVKAIMTDLMQEYLGQC